MNTSPAIAARTGGRDLLAAALRDSRARTLALLDAYVASARRGAGRPVFDRSSIRRSGKPGMSAGSRTIWIARNRQRALGIACDPDHAPSRRPPAGGRCAVRLQPRRPRDALAPAAARSRGDARLSGRRPGRNAGPARRRPRRPTTRCISSASCCSTRTCTPRRPSTWRRRSTFRCPRRCCARASLRCPPRRDIAMPAHNLEARLTPATASPSTTNCAPTTSNSQPSKSTAWR